MCGSVYFSTMYRHVTRMLLECRDELKFTPRALILLIGTQLVEMKELDNCARYIENILM